jgi:LuxR family maltose regulon positive regulatory protein
MSEPVAQIDDVVPADMQDDAVAGRAAVLRGSDAGGPDSSASVAAFRPIVPTKVQAPTVPAGAAGFGKTWLVSGWLQTQSDVAQCWVSIDEHDQDPPRLWRHLLAAVARSGVADAADDALRMLSTSDVGPPMIVDALAGGLARQDRQLIMVLDDVHLLPGGDACTSLGQLLRELPPHIHVVLIGRHDPAIPLTRWRPAGRLLELRTSDLRCTLDESQALVTRCLGVDMAPDVIADIHSRTMGWIAGVRLAATAVAQAAATGTVTAMPAVGTIAGAYDAVGDYLIEEVLDHLDAAERRFLLESSILDELSGPACDAVTGQPGSADLLDRLARSGTFTTRIDGDGPTYRYHELFRATVRGLLHRTAPDHVTTLHRRAARWLHDSGDVVGAVEHAIAADEPELAGAWLVAVSRELLAAKQADTLVKLCGDVDDAMPHLPPSVLIVWTLAVLYSAGDEAAIAPLLDRSRRRLAELTAEERRQMERVLPPIGTSQRDVATELRLRIDATIANRGGDIALALSANEALGEAPSATGWVEAVAGTMWIHRGQYARGEAMVRRWTDYSFSARNPLIDNRAHALSLRAMSLHGQGRLAEAEQTAGRALDALRHAGLVDRPQYAASTVPAAWVAWERGDLVGAEQLVVGVLDRLARFGDVPSHVLAQLLLARIQWSSGRPSEAWATLDHAVVTPVGRAVRGHFAERIALERARLALLEGDAAVAQDVLPDWRRRIGRGARSPREHVLLARLAIAAGEDAAALLTDHDDAPPAHRIDHHLLRALAAIGQRERAETEALDCVLAALRIAAQTGHRQVFVDDQVALGPLLRNAAAMCGVSLHLRGPALPAPGGTDQVHRLYEPLTARELDVIALLPTHLSYREIAERLFVSTNTVKSYMKSIYRKLGVAGRSDAVAAVRALDLIDAT